jgi:hypothetical protein
MEHPITPPPELVQQWANESPMECSAESWAYELFIAHHAAQWGADQELEACCEWLEKEREHLGWAYRLNPQTIRAARRPKPPSLKEQALEELEQLRGDANSMGMGFDAPAIRRALEALPNG